MAQTSAVEVPGARGVMTKCSVSSLTIDTAITLTHGGPLQVPDRITFEVTTTPTDKSVVNLVRTKASDSAANGTANITFQAADNAGGTGSLSGFVADVYCHFDCVKAGGIG